MRRECGFPSGHQPSAASSQNPESHVPVDEPTQRGDQSAELPQRFIKGGDEGGAVDVFAHVPLPVQWANRQDVHDPEDRQLNRNAPEPRAGARRHRVWCAEQRSLVGRRIHTDIPI